MLATGGLAYREYRARYVGLVQSHAVVEAELIGAALRSQMLDEDIGLLQEMVERLSGRAAIERIMVLERSGEVRVSSDPARVGEAFSVTGKSCSVCHNHPPAARQQIAVVELDEGRLLRCVQPILNEPECHRCHGSEQIMNGVVIVDIPIGAALLDMKRSVQRLGFGTAAAGLAMLACIAFALRRLVTGRLQTFEQTARAIAKGDLTRRVPVEGTDALTRLQVQFNEMTDSVVRLLAQLEEQRANLARVMNSVDDGLVVLDESMTLVATNDAFARRFAPVAGSLVGRRCCGAPSQGALGCSAVDEGDCPTRRCFVDGEVATAIRTRRAADGLERIEEVRASAVLGPDGSITAVVELWRDITDRRSAEARLASYQRMASLGMLASGFSHEVNTPLASVETCLDAIGRRAPDDDVLDYVRVAREQVERVGAITRQFLELARGSSIAREVVELREQGALVARLAGPMARRAGVAVSVENDGGPVTVVANRGAIQQVLLNLVLNAIAASDRGGSVRITYPPSEPVEVHVEDSGRGIAPEDRPRLFEPFFSRRPNGTGLGLFISQNLARAWGGDVRLVTTSPRVGTTFGVVFAPNKEIDEGEPPPSAAG